MDLANVKANNLKHYCIRALFRELNIRTKINSNTEQW